MEFISNDNVTVLSNPGVESHQLLSPYNSDAANVTITRVRVQPGVTQPRHSHENSEQIWCALFGTGKLLLDGNKTKRFSAGDVVRIEKGEVHGLYNDGKEYFEYMSVTSPPIDFGYAYRDKHK